jgi:predicted MFS family arabinose efflux permease
MPQAIITSCTTTSSGPIPDCLPMTDYIWGLTVGFYALGGIVGGMGTMYTNVWFGRRANLLICSGFFAFGSILTALAVNVAMVCTNSPKP